MLLGCSHIGNTAVAQIVRITGSAATSAPTSASFGSGVLVPEAVGPGRTVLLVPPGRTPMHVTMAGTPAAGSLHVMDRFGRRTQTDVSHFEIYIHTHTPEG